jgi:hypothetical protein
MIQSNYLAGRDIDVRDQRLPEFLEYLLISEIGHWLGRKHVAYSLDVPNELAKPFGFQRETMIGPLPGAVQRHVFLEDARAFHVRDRPRKYAIEMV